jgi:hypothetical protein
MPKVVVSNVTKVLQIKFKTRVKDFNTIIFEEKDFDTISSYLKILIP